MKSLGVPAPTGFALATAIAVICTAAAVAVVVLYPAPTPTDDYVYPVDFARFEAASAITLILIAIALRRRQEAMSYALLAAACVVAGWAIQAFWLNSVTARTPAFGLELLTFLSTVSGATGVLAIFASTPPRRLARSAPLLLGAVVVATVVAAGIETWIEMSGWTGDYLSADHTGLIGSFAGSFTTLLPLMLVFVAGVLGSLRNEALRFVPTSPLPPRPRAVSRGMLIGFAVALVVALGLAIAWNLGLPTAPVSMLLPLLAALVGIVAARWSTYVAWTAVAVSLGMSALAIFSAALDVEVSKFVNNPSAPWTPTTEWIVRAGLTWLVAILAIASASYALGAARNAMAGRAVRVTPGPLIVTTLTIGAVVWAAVAWLLSTGNIGYPWLEVPYWTTWVTFLFLASLLVIAAAEAARGRLVPALAEAEAVARRPFRPFRYLETVVIEALTGRAAVRRTATADERSRLASDLHAEVLPSLAAIAAQYEAGAPKEDVAVRLRQLEEDVRALMAERRLVVLEEFGIVEAIEWLLGRAEERVTLEIGLSVDDRTTSERPPREVERAAFRIAQLAVENALQHAFPTKLTLEILARSDQVRISVADNGRGFADPSADRTRDHVGIADMRSQAAEVRGDVQVMAPLAGGTTVTFAWPAA